MSISMSNIEDKYAIVRSSVNLIDKNLWIEK